MVTGSNLQVSIQPAPPPELLPTKHEWYDVLQAVWRSKQTLDTLFLTLNQTGNGIYSILILNSKASRFKQ